MAQNGEGKYDDICTVARETAQAQAAIVLIIGGNKGQGFSVQSTFEVQLAIPKMLRDIANQIETHNKTLGH